MDAMESGKEVGRLVHLDAVNAGGQVFSSFMIGSYTYLSLPNGFRYLMEI